MENSNRRTFLQFLGKGIVGTVLVPTLITGCNTTENKTVQKIAKKLKALAPSSDDVLSLADGFNFDILVKWGESISEKDTFGFNNDFTAFIPSSKNNSEEGILWVNHEYVQPSKSKKKCMMWVAV